MSLFDMCCPKKPKKSLDYVIKWVEDADKTIKDLEEWKENISTETLKPIFDEYSETYPWDNVPAFNAKADKVESAVAGNFASLDSEGNLQDSEKKPADFALVGHSHSAILDAGTESNISIDEGTISIVVEGGGSGGETEINADNIGNLHRALMKPDDVPTQGSNNLITSEGVYNYKPSCIEDAVEDHQYAKVYVDNHNQGEPSVIIELNDNNTPGSPVTKSTIIGINNIDNLNRALATPSSTPEDDDTKLITSKAVYDELSGKASSSSVNSLSARIGLLESYVVTNSCIIQVDISKGYDGTNYYYIIRIGNNNVVSASTAEYVTLQYIDDIFRLAKTGDTINIITRSGDIILNGTISNKSLGTIKVSSAFDDRYLDTFTPGTGVLKLSASTPS